MQLLRQKRGQIRPVDTSAHYRLRSRQAADLLFQDVHQLLWSVRPTVGHGALEVTPNTFIRIQFRGMRRKRNQMQTGRATQKLARRFSPMSLAVVQQNEQTAADLMQQLAEKHRDFFALDIVLVELAVQGAMEALRTDGDARDGRDPVVAITMTQERSLSDGAPRLPDRRDQEEARFVDKDDMGRQPGGVFFTWGQTDRFHSWMADSSRSTARRSGFWWLQPNWWRSLPT